MKTFESVAQMKLAKLQAGQLTETKGYYTSGDSGAGRYLIAAAQAVDGFGDHTLANGNVALLQASGAVNVLHYGATGDGVTDDYASFLAALSSLKLTGGSVLVPEGEFIISETLFVTSEWANPIVIQGSSYESTKLQYSGSKTTPLFDVTTQTVKFYDMEMAGTWEVVDGIAYIGQAAIDFGTTEFCEVVRCHLHNWAWDGIAAFNSGYMYVSECYIYTNSREGIILSIGCHNCTVTNNTFFDNKWHFDTNGHNMIIEGNSFLATQSVADTWGITVERNDVAWKVENIIIANNVFEGTGDTGINVSGTVGTPPSNVLITGNVMRLNIANDSRYGEGITIHGADDVVVEGNIISEFQSTSGTLWHGVGVRLYEVCNRIKISDNKFHKGTRAIQFHRSATGDLSDISITNNDFYAVASCIDSAFIATSSITGVTVAGNKVDTANDFYIFSTIVATDGFYGENYLRNVVNEVTGSATPTGSIIRHLTETGDLHIGSFTSSDSKTGSFTLVTLATTTVANSNVTANSVILLSPTNSSAGQLMGSGKGLFILTKTAGTSFQVRTGNTVLPAGTETFDYLIVN